MKQAIEARPEAQITGPNEKLFLCDKAGNRYYYKTDVIAHSYIQKLSNGKSRCYFGFDTFTVVPEEADAGLMQIEPGAMPVNAVDEEDPF